MANKTADSVNHRQPIVVQRRFVKVAGRFVHYRTAGHGPPIVLIHQSPKSSAELVEMIGELARDFTVFAPDTPGYGDSDPLPDNNADIDDFVDALVLLFESLGLNKPALFGSHSGAIFGVRLAARYPDRICALIANGVLINDQATRDDLVANYFPEFKPTWEGSHLPRVWSRIRDQHCYYPWYQRHPDNRIHWPASLEEMQESAMEILVAGEHYKTGYRAVLDYDISPDLIRLSVPCLLVVAEVDALVHYVPLYPETGPNVQVKVVPGFSDIPAETAAFAHSYTKDSAHSHTPRLTGEKTTSAGLAPAIFTWQQKAVFYRMAIKRKAPVIVFLHDVTRSSRQNLSLLTALSEKATVIAPDLAGHGKSDRYDYHDGTHSSNISAWLSGLLQSRAINDVIMITEGASWPFGMALLNDGVVKVSKWICVSPFHPDTSKEYQPPSLTPDAGGSQLNRAWYYVRDRQLFAPYSRLDEKHMLSPASLCNTDMMQEEANDVLISRHSHGLHYQLIEEQIAGWRLLNTQAYSVDKDDYVKLQSLL